MLGRVLLLSDYNVNTMSLLLLHCWCGLQGDGQRGGRASESLPFLKSNITVLELERGCGDAQGSVRDLPAADSGQSERLQGCHRLGYCPIGAGLPQANPCGPDKVGPPFRRDTKRLFVSSCWCAMSNEAVRVAVWLLVAPCAVLVHTSFQAERHAGHLVMHSNFPPCIV